MPGYVFFLLLFIFLSFFYEIMHGLAAVPLPPYPVHPRTEMKEKERVLHETITVRYLA